MMCTNGEYKPEGVGVSRRGGGVNVKINSQVLTCVFLAFTLSRTQEELNFYICLS